MTSALSANDLPKLLKAAYQNLQNHEEEINKLNVFPVPDGDTGTNLVLTMEAVVNELTMLNEPSIANICEAITQGSLLGARGNSGVILSQIIRGICDVFKNLDSINTLNIADSLMSAQKVAYQAIKKPVEGTMLTVIKDMANEAQRIADGISSIEEFLETVLIEGQLSVNRTTELLPVLKEAGVVDAGGHGLVVLVDGALRELRGEPIEMAKVSLQELPNFFSDEESEFGYCTEFLLKSDSKELNSLEEKIAPLGDSILVVGSDKVRRVHIHTDSPGKILEMATSIGSISKVQINNMDEQSAERRQENIRQQDSHQNIGIVAVANGLGIKEILYSLGVNNIVDGGQSMNPSTADFIRAIDELPQSEIIILPNNKNIILSAKQAVESSSKKVKVVSTKSIPEAFTAMFELNQEQSIDTNVEKMEKALSMVKTGQVTLAIRDTKIKNKKIRRNDFIGLSNGEIVISGEEFINVTLDLINDMVTKEDENITLLKGAEAKYSEIEEICNKIDERFPWLEREVHDGGQPLYHLIMAIE